MERLRRDADHQRFATFGPSLDERRDWNVLYDVAEQVRTDRHRMRVNAGPRIHTDSNAASYKPSVSQHSIRIRLQREILLCLVPTAVFSVLATGMGLLTPHTSAAYFAGSIAAAGVSALAVQRHLGRML
ncbi:hypothetical protein Mal15_54320 [Stieleria maiorica]|uniref:Uncharacterized protein n=1 Tax=Stieleria maiorica TaxID=2795974 RepID=A0A5B9MNZ8_9BACT|nr:hypothetical protein Mal15_54320 [Stieleria maiorica]